MTFTLKALFGVLLFTWSTSVYAEKISFDKFSELSDKIQKEHSKAFKAQFKFKALKSSRCTGTYISNEGHGLTAAHCVSGCMPFPGVEGLKKWKVPVVVNGKKSKHSVIANTWSYPQVCEATIDGEKKKIKILSGSKGMHANPLPVHVAGYFRQYIYLTQTETDSFKDLWIESFYDHWGMGADFAIFEVLENKKTECLKISKDRSFAGEHYVLSYPGKTSFSSKEINNELYLSRGSLTEDNYFNSEFIVIKDTSGRYLNSSIHAYPGSSGAGLVNPRTNELSGVLSLVAGGVEGSDIPLPAAGFVSSKVVREVAGDLLNGIQCSN